MSEAANPTAAPKPRHFQADVARLLHLMVHSVYSERDIFLRELVSNAADACEKLRYEALAKPELKQGDAPFAITIEIDKEAGTLSVVDNGVGMSEDDLVNALGTIASSGTRAFLDKLAAKAPSDEEREEDGGAGDNSAGLIGQFGIGFYSAFMVADRVHVVTRRAGTAEALAWESDGKGDYTITPAVEGETPPQGTRVTLHLNDASKTYLEPWRVETIVREHSGGVAVPISLKDTPTAEPRPLTDGGAIWTKPKSALTEKDYAGFYQTLASQFDDPALTIHWRAEGRHEYTVLAFIPGSRPLDLFDPARKSRGKLYVRRVLISQDSDLLPGWLRFARLVVDSADLPLNVSREMIQESAVFAAIKRGVANRIVQELTKLADNEPEKFAKIWENFGAVIKEGLYEDFERRDAIYKIARFASTKTNEQTRSLANYVADLRPNQTAIYYHTGVDAARISASPQLEGFRARGIEVLLLSDPVDPFWISNAAGFDGKPFKSASQGAADIKLVPYLEGNEAPSAEAPSAEVATFMAFVKQTLGEEVSDVRASDRLAESPACLVATEDAPDRRMERLLAEHGRLKDVSKPVFEVNPNHALVASLAGKFAAGGDRSLVEDAAWLLFYEARLMDGEKIADPAAFAARLRRVIGKAAT